MYKKYNGEVFIEIIFGILIIYVLARIFIPIINPVNAASDIGSERKSVYEQIIDKSNFTIETAMDKEDEDQKGLFTIGFKYLTGIDLDNPKSYLASQIPILQLIDITAIASEDSGPVIITPNENNTENQNKEQENKGQTSLDQGKEVKPANDESVQKKKLDPKKPLILIYHTHTSENYNPKALKDQNFTYNYNIGVCKVGDELKKELENKYGIATLHDTTVHDVPLRDGAYAKSRPTIQSYLKKYPSIKIIIDLHRDGNVPKNSCTAIINNQKYARVMFVEGTKYSTRNKNDKLFKKLNSTFNSLYPGFSRGIDYKNAKYNQDLSEKIVLLEVGSNINSLEEAVNSVKIIAEVLAKNI